MDQERVRITGESVLSNDWYTLKKIRFELLRRDGKRQSLAREVYQSGDGVTILLHDPARRTVLLTRQFRLPARVAGRDGFLIEAPAGIVENANPEESIRKEVEQETGFRISRLRPLYELFMNPASVTERVHFFTGQYEPAARCGDGGGLEHEGEDIEVLELGYEEALAKMAAGEIVDGKTVLLLQYLQQHLMKSDSLMILLAGPYLCVGGHDCAMIAHNLAALQAYTLPLYQAGHLPVFGAGLALPLGQLSETDCLGEGEFDSLSRQHAARLLARCDAVLRIGGPSLGADALLELGRSLGLRIFNSLAEVPHLNIAT